MVDESRGTAEGAPKPACPLCGAKANFTRLRAHGREYLDCGGCGLTFMAAAERLSGEEERARYEQHRNDPGDAGYRAFLSRLFTPLLERIPPSAEGLDYGSGPGPTLSVMLEEAGHAMALWDPYFAPDTAVLDRRYDFITSTETFEHFHEPAMELKRLDALLRNGGWLAVMTQLRDERPFETWWYVRDPTHVCFYRARTMEWIAAARGWSLERPAPNVAMFHKRVA